MQAIRTIIATRLGATPFRAAHDATFPGHPDELRALRAEQARGAPRTAAPHAFRTAYKPQLLDVPADYERRRAPFLGRAL